MDKPIVLLIREFNEKIVQDINSSNLPIWKVRDELDKIMLEVNKVCVQEEQRQIAEYEKELEKNKMEELRDKRTNKGNKGGIK